MFYPCALLIGMISPIFWPFNAETAALFVGLVGTRNAVLVGAVLALGETLTLTGLFFGGNGVVRRVGWLRKKVDRLREDEERMARYRQNAAGGLVVSALLAVPPLSVLAILAPAFGVRWRTLATISFLGRWIRFALIAAVPGLFPTSWFTLESLPDWLRALV